MWKVELQVKSTAYKHKVMHYKNTHTQPQSHTKRQALYQLIRMAFQSHQEQLPENSLLDVQQQRKSIHFGNGTEWQEI